MKTFLIKNWEAIGGIIIIIIAFCAGRYSSPEKIKTEIKTVEVEKIVTKIQHQTITIRENKDGSKDTVIITDTKSDQTDKAKSKTDEKEVTLSKDKLNISLLAGGSLPFTSPIIGVSLQKNFIGPITLGGWLLNNSTGGLSIGINF